MYVAKLAAENKLQAGKSFTCPLGTFTIYAKNDPVSGATKNTIIFSKPLEFTKANYKRLFTDKFLKKSDVCVGEYAKYC